MTLKGYMQETLNNKVEELVRERIKTEAALHTLQITPDRHRTYIVNLESLWADNGETSTSTTYTGTLKNAIEKAEEEFKTTNNRHDVQAEYHVGLLLGSTNYPIPSQFYEKFKEKK